MCVVYISFRVLEVLIDYVKLCFSTGVITFLTGLIVLGLYKLFPLQVQLIFLLDTSHLVEDHEEGTNCPPLELEQVKYIFSESCLFILS